MNFVLMPIAHGVEIKPIQEDYASGLIDKIRSKLTDLERPYLISMPYNYSHKTNSRQMQMYNAVDAGLKNKELRRLKNIIGSDVTWSFIVAKGGKHCFYKMFLDDVSNMIEEGLLKYPKAKIAMLGHSQGSQLLYSTIFDIKHNVDLFISMGSPISMNSGAWDNWGKRPINLGAWINFYHDIDFISSQLQYYHPSKEVADFVVDYRVPTGLNPLHYLPEKLFKIRLLAGFMAHVSYWKSKYVANVITEKIRELIHLP